MLKCIIIDDEPKAREKVELLVKKFCPQLELVAVCKNGEEGLDAIEKEHPDLIFLDIEMPGLSGFDMLKQIGKINFEIIFTTAHDHYAIRAIKFAALDYLLKPIDLEQLQDAVNRAIIKREERNSEGRYTTLVSNINNQNKKLDSIALPTSTGMIFVKVDDIVRCESISNYTCFKLINKEEVIATHTMKEYEELLSDSGFIRIHHSHIINKKYLKRYIKGAGGQVEMADGSTLDVSRRKKEEVMEKLRN